MPIPRSILPLTACCLLQSCFTAAVWGVDIDADCADPAPAETRREASEPDQGLLDHLAARLVLTPFALALDCLTCPIQAFVLGCDEDEDEDEDARRYARSRGADRERAAIHAR
jgi:hypothetical protein